MPKQDGSPTAVVASGGKQYRVAAGDTILVDRLGQEPGAELSLGVLLLAGGEEIRIGTPLVEGATVMATVVGHRRGPKIDVLRYKSKKRVRVHRGARADLTAIRIVSLGGDVEPAAKPAPRRRAAKSVPAEATDGA